jgi:hypothetical protein
MHALRSRLLAPRHFAWLLWLALLLPLAQGAAAWHALSHTGADLSPEHDGKALHATHCDLCLTAADVIGGVLPGEPPPLFFATVRHTTPLPQPVGAASVAPARAYLSRAPPFASH